MVIWISCIFSLFVSPFHIYDWVNKIVILPGALMLNHENKKEIDYMTTQWLKQYHSL